MSQKYYTGTFDAPWSPALMWITWGVSAGFLLVILFSWIKLGSAAWLVSTILLLTIGITALFAVKGYELRGETLIVQRLFWQTRVDLTKIQSARVAPDVFKKSIKTCGNGGLFSFSGYFWSKSLGTFKCYVTDAKRAVLLEVNGKKIMVSPDSPEGFVRALGFEKLQ